MAYQFGAQLNGSTPSTGDDSKGVLVVSAVFAVANTLLIVLRFSTQHITRRWRALEDALVALSYLTTMAMIAVTIVQVQYAGLGKDISQLEFSQLILFGKAAFAFSILYIVGVTAPKLATLCLYSRFLVHELERRVCYTFMAFTLAYGTFGLIFTCLSCIPLYALWDPYAPKPHCVSLISWWRWSTVPSTVIDAILLALPFRSILRATLPKRDKIGILVCLSTGAIGMIASLVRLFTFINTDDVNNVTKVGVRFAIASIIECSAYCIAICLQMLRPLYLYIRNRFSNEGESIRLDSKPWRSSCGRTGSSPSRHVYSAA